MEVDIAAMQSDLDDAINGRSAADERADRLQAEVHRLAEELRQEQENYKNAESLRKQLEVEIREITVRLEEAEAFAMREGKRQIAKLQARVSSYYLLPKHFTESTKSEPRYEKTGFCICENKNADQLRSNCTADQRLLFRYIYSVIPLLSKSEISSL